MLHMNARSSVDRSKSSRERGATAVEYAMVVAGIAVVTGVAATLFGQVFIEFFEGVAAQIFSS